jgi:hypothetical protein
MHSFLIIGQQFFYLDPGSGSFIVQMLIAGFLGAGLAITIFWKKIKSFFGKGTTQSDDSEEETDDENKSN